MPESPPEPSACQPPPPLLHSAPVLVEAALLSVERPASSEMLGFPE